MNSNHSRNNSQMRPVHGERESEYNQITGTRDFRVWFQPRAGLPGRWVTQAQWDQIYEENEQRKAAKAAKQQDGTDVTGQIDRLKEISRTFLQELDAMKAGGECDPRWLAMAKTEMQTACMFACRAVAKPSDDC